jgi:tRNA (mo5U34)-methyltransferase
MIMTENEKKLDQLFRYHRWRQRIPLENNLETPGTNYSDEWDGIFLPADLRGKSFLDVGSNDGMFSFLAEKKGASRIVSTDIYNDGMDSHMTDGWNITGITLAKNYLNSKIEVNSHSIYDLHKINGDFDLVYCANVLAWLKDPLSALEQLGSKATQTLFLREDISKNDTPYPMLEMVHDYNAPRATCFYNPNKAWFETNLKGLGFKNVEFRLVDEKAIELRKRKEFAKYKIPQGTSVFESPFDNASSRNTDAEVQPRSTYVFQDFLFFPRIGWIKKSAAERMPDIAIQESTGLKAVAKKILGKNEEWPQINHTIVAMR